MRRFSVAILAFVALAVISSGCGKKNPSRDEIPVIKTQLAKLESAIKEGNAAAVDSLIMAQSYDLGYSSTSIFDSINAYLNGRPLYGFSKREFFYTKNEGVVKCALKADSADAGRPVEIILEKAGDTWLIKRFDLK